MKDQRGRFSKEMPTIDLGIAGRRVPVHSHLARIWETDEDFSESVGFLAAGLRGRDHGVLIADRDDLERALAILREHDVDGDSAVAGSRLTVIAWKPTAEAMLASLTAAFESALTAGAPLVRLLANVGWGREAGPADAELLRCEASLTDLADRFPCVILCLHPIHALTGPIARHGVLATHARMLDEGRVLKNPFFVPPAKFGHRLQKMAAELSQSQGDGEARRRSAEILQAVFDNIPVMVSFRDAALRLVLVNREWERVLGWSLSEAQRTDVIAEANPDTKMRRLAMEQIRRADRRWYDFRTRTRDGRKIDTSWAQVALSDGTHISFGQDITERKRTEEALRESEQGFRAVFESALDAIVIIDDEGRYVDVNPAACALFGLTQEEFLARRVGEASAPGLDAMAEFRALRRAGQARADWRIMRPDGATRHVEYAGRADVLPDRNLVVLRDVTERKLADEAQRESEQRFRAVFESALDAVVITADGGRFVEVNPAACALFGRHQEDLLERHWSEVSAPGLDTVEQWRAISVAGQDEGEWRILRPDGTVRDVEYSARVNFLPGRHFALLRDVTDRKRSEQALRESEERYRTLFEAGPLPKILFDPETFRIIAVNERAIDHYGYSREEFLRMTILDYRPHEDAEKVRAVMSEPHPPLWRAGVFRHIRKDGALMFVDVTIAEVLIDGRSLRLVNIFDVTEQRTADERLQKSHGELQALTERLRVVREQERTQMAREVHDEVGQALTALHMDVAWLQRKRAAGGDDRAELDSKLQSMSALIDTTLDAVQRIATELRPGVLDELGLEAAIEWYVREFEQRTGIECSFRDELDERQNAPGSSTAVFRILQEALTNAARHSVATRVRIRLASDRDRLRLEIRDNGRGIPADRIESSASLGLVGMRERARALGGDVEIRGAMGRGTTVALTIPR